MANNVWLGTTSDWGVASNWSTGAVPTASDGDTVVLSGSSPLCSVGSSNKVCNRFLVSGFTNTLSFGTRTLTVSGEIYLETGMTITGTGTLAINSSANITTNGMIIPVPFGFQGTSQTYTLQDDMNLIGSASLNGTTSLTINNNGTEKIIYAMGSVTASAAGCAGSAKIIMNGTGTTLLSTTAAIQNDIDIDSVGTIQLGSGLRYANGLFRWLNGTIDATTFNNTFTIGLTSSVSTRIESSAVTWNNITFGSNQTATLLSDLNCAGGWSSTGVVALSGNSNVNIYGRFSVGGANHISNSGSTKIRFIGSDCYWNTGSGQNRMPTEIAPSGTFTLSGATANININTVTYISGNTDTSNGTLVAVGSVTMKTSGMTWTNFNITQSTTTLDEPLYVSNLMTLCTAGSVTFAGSYGFDVGHLQCTTANRSITLKTGLTYNVINQITTRGTASPSTSPNSVTLQSNVTSGYAYLNVNPTATTSCLFTRAIDIDSSGGREMYAVKGLVLRTVNWVRTNPDAFAFF